MLGSCQSSVLSGSKMLFDGLNGQFEDLNVSNLLKEGFLKTSWKIRPIVYPMAHMEQSEFRDLQDLFKTQEHILFILVFNILLTKARAPSTPIRAI